LLLLLQIYYIFGFLFLVMIVLVVTCAEVSILLCYFQVQLHSCAVCWVLVNVKRAVKANCASVFADFSVCDGV
jgi:hypothetical protein